MTRSTTRTAPNRRNLFLVGGVTMLAVIVTIMSALVLGRGPATAADEPSPTPVPTVEPSETPEQSEAPVVEPEPAQEPVVEPSDAPAPSEAPLPVPVVHEPVGVLQPESVIRVVVDALRLRYEPTVDSEQTGMLRRGDLAVIPFIEWAPGFGPIEADGYTWYMISPLGVSELPDVGEPAPERLGAAWIAVGTDTMGFVETVAPRCPTGDVDLDTLNSMFGLEHVVCLGNRSITIEGTFGCGGCGAATPPGGFEPSWLAGPINLNYFSVDPSDRIGPFRLTFQPGIGFPEEGRILRVTGHFADARSSECEIAPGDPPVRLDDELAELRCAMAFVVDRWDVIGFDERMPNT